MKVCGSIPVMAPASRKKHRIPITAAWRRQSCPCNKAFPSFALLDQGRHGEERSCVLIERGRFYGMGYLPVDNSICDAETLKDYLTRYPENN